MRSPKLHHYVPQFYLKRFTDHGRFWAFDKVTNQSFPTNPKGIAAETHFYESPLLGKTNNALFIENSLADIEGDAATITGKWLTQLEQMKPLEKLEISETERTA